MAHPITISVILICLKTFVLTKNVPDCPSNEDHSHYVLYGSPPKCFLIGERGPCNLGQKLLREQESRFGTCACDCFKSSVFDSSKLQFCNDGDLNEYVYHPVWRTCFRLGDQGPCKAGEMFVKDSRDSGDPVFCAKMVNVGKLVQKRDANGAGAKRDSCFPLECVTADVDSFDAPIIPTSCPNGMVYSSLLTKCLKRRTLSFKPGK